MLCEDEASFAPWGSLRSPWARRGQQPEVPTSGQRTGSKVFGAMTVSVDKALAYFARHPETILGRFGLYCEESGLELKQAA